MPASRHRLPRLLLLTLIGAQAMGIGVIISLLADIQDRSGFATWSLGAITGVAFAFTLVAHLWLAPMADRGWERPLIAAGGVLAVVALSSMGVASELWHWIAARALLGFAEGVSVAAGRRVMLSWERRRQGKALSSLAVALMVGFLVGPPIGAVLNQIDRALPFLAPALVVTVLLPFVVLVRPGEYDQGRARLDRRTLTLLPGLAPGLLLAASPWLMIGVLDSMWARYMTDLGAGPMAIGVGFLALGVPSVLVTPISGRMADRMNPVRLALAGAMVELPLVAAFGFVGSTASLLVLGALHSAACSFVTPPGQAAVAKVAPPGQAAEAQGLIEAYGLVLAGAGAFTGPALYAAGGPILLFSIMTAALAVTPLLVWRHRRSWRAEFS